MEQRKAVVFAMQLIRASMIAFRGTGSWAVANNQMPYQFELRPLDWVLDNIWTCWKPRATIRQVGAAIMTDPAYVGNRAKVSKLEQEELWGVTVSTFRHSALKRMWASEYPNNSSIPDDGLIAEDANHRLVALARRVVLKLPTPTLVGVFVALV